MHTGHMNDPINDASDNQAVADAAATSRARSARQKRARMIKLALILAAIAIGFYVLSIVSIIHTRGGAA